MGRQTPCNFAVPPWAIPIGNYAVADAGILLASLLAAKNSSGTNARSGSVATRLRRGDVATALTLALQNSRPETPPVKSCGAIASTNSLLAEDRRLVDPLPRGELLVDVAAWRTCEIVNKTSQALTQTGQPWQPPLEKMVDELLALGAADV